MPIVPGLKLMILVFFSEEAAGFIFAKDRDWKQHVKMAKKSPEKA